MAINKVVFNNFSISAALIISGCLHLILIILFEAMGGSWMRHHISLPSYSPLMVNIVNSNEFYRAGKVTDNTIHRIANLKLDERIVEKAKASEANAASIHSVKLGQPPTTLLNTAPSQDSGVQQEKNIFIQKSQPEQPSIETIMRSARIVVREMAMQEKQNRLRHNFQAEATQPLSDLAQPSPSPLEEYKFSDGRVRVVTKFGTVFCLKPRKAFEASGIGSRLDIPVLCD